MTDESELHSIVYEIANNALIALGMTVVPSFPRLGDPSALNARNKELLTRHLDRLETELENELKKLSAEKANVGDLIPLDERTIVAILVRSYKQQSKPR